VIRLQKRVLATCW